MQRTTLNFWIDALALAGFLVLASTGILLRYQLPPGSGRIEATGSGLRAQEHSITLVGGLTRHAWGDVHTAIALGLMGVLALHLALHWKWIVCVVRGKPASASGRRLLLGAAGLVGFLLLALAPLWAPREQVPRSQWHAPSAAETQGAVIRGEMTWAALSAQTGVPTDYLFQQLGLPPTTDPQQQLGQARRAARFSLEEVRQLVAGYEPP
jgi:hypothetical protein